MADAPTPLGSQAPLSEQLRVGYDTDIIGLSESAFNNIDVLADPVNMNSCVEGKKIAEVTIDIRLLPDSLTMRESKGGA